MENTKQLIKKIASEFEGLQYDVIMTKQSNLSLSAHKGDLEKYQVSSSNVVGIRVVLDNRVGVSYSEAIDEGSLRYMVEQAISNSKVSKVNENEVIAVAPDNAIIDTDKVTFIPDNTPIEEKINLCLELEKKILDKADDVKCPYNGVSEVDVERVVFNSLGLDRKAKDKYFSCYSSALFNRGEKSGLHYKASCSRTFKGLDVNECVEESYKIATDFLEAKPVPTGSYDIIFEVGQLESLLDIFTNCFCAQEAIDKTNPWADKISQKVAHESLTIVDSPRVEGSFAYVPFDSEGTIPQDLTLVENGVLKNFFHNSKTSKELGMENNGRASRSPKGSLSVNGTNTVIKVGSQDVRQGDFLELISLDGLHSGANPISGAFSFGASGYLYRDGKVVQAVKGITISGNYYEMIQNLEIGNEMRVSDAGNFHSPDILFKSLSVAGV